MRANMINKMSWMFRSVGVMLLCCVTFALTGCKEDLAEGDYAISTEQTVTDYLKDNPSQFSELKAIFDRVALGDTTGNASSLTNVLSARGNYTVFAPTNEAIAAYLQTLGVSSVAELTYEQARLIAYSCIIDNEDQSAYEEADFPESGSFDTPNLNDRLLTCSQDTTGTSTTYIINGNARIEKSDIEVSNGMIHSVSAVIAPSSDNLYELIAAADNMKIIAHLMEVTHWADSMNVQERDLAYEEVEHELTFVQSGVPGTFSIPQRRYIGFTALIEPDDVYAKEWGISLQTNAAGEVQNWDEVMQTIAAKCEQIYGASSVAANDYANPDNAVNRFVAYHFLYGKMAYNKFVQHFNEWNYKYGSDPKSPQTVNMPTNVWDYYTTMGKHRGLIKITQVGDGGFEHDLDHKIYANRISIYNNATINAGGDYTETGVVSAGLLISADNGSNDNNAQNGFYYPINAILTYDQTTRERLGGERMRMDIVTMLPEIASNTLRHTGYYRFPNGYLDNITNESAGTVLLYMAEPYYPNGVGTWKDYQGDEFTVCGQYDFILKLPPVPVDGTYEVRIGASHNSMRGMVQMYFGNNKNSLPPVGLPYDMRLPAGSVSIPWVEDTEDDATNIENDKNLRNQGYMKGPQYYTKSGTGTTAVRNADSSIPAIRRIVTTQYLRANETYYMRFKSALKNTSSQLFLDLFEIVPSQIYNGTESEDIW